MASFVGKTGSSRQTRAILHTVSYLVSIRSNYRGTTKKIILESMWRIIRAEKNSILQFGSNIRVARSAFLINVAVQKRAAVNVCVTIEIECKQAIALAKSNHNAFQMKCVDVA